MNNLQDNELRPTIRFEKFVDSRGVEHILSTGPSSIRQKLTGISGMNSFRVPNQVGDIQFHPRVNINPRFTSPEELEALLQDNGVLVYLSVTVKNFFGEFHSKEPVLALIIHGNPHDWRHEVLGDYQSVDYFVGLRDYLLSKGIRPPQLFLACDEQIRADRQEGEVKIKIRRFWQKPEYQVLGFPYLENQISLDQGVITVEEADMKLKARANSGSAFANPLDEDTSLLDLVVKLFDCPEPFLKLNNKRSRPRIRIIN